MWALTESANAQTNLENRGDFEMTGSSPRPAGGCPLVLFGNPRERVVPVSAPEVFGEQSLQL